MTSDTPVHTRTRNLAISGLLAAMLCVSAYLAIPLQPVPVTLQLLVVVLTALLLPAAWAAAAVGTYLALGAAGVPVFSAGQGGLGVLAGPTGGYLAGFLVAVVTAAFVRSVVRRFTGRDLVPDVIAASIVVAVVYLIGTPQLALVAHLDAGKAIAVGVVPFIVPDAIKAAVAVVVAQAIRRALGA